MIDTSILTTQAVSEDEVFNCWSHTEPSDVAFCRVCPHAYLCRDRAIKSIIAKMNEQEKTK